MVRSIIPAAILGAAVAAAAVYLLGPPARQDLLTPSVRSPNPSSEAEAWPICTTMASVVDGTDWAQLEPDFAAGKKALAAGQWTGAIAALKLASLRDPRNADIQNYIGYAYRRLGQLELAFAHFQQTITLNPRHRGAYQHLGESYLALGDLVKAEEHLAALERICLIPCEEYGDLHRAIASSKKAEGR
jgi:tetratricopeptide (TPR) repeat protein